MKSGNRQAVMDAFIAPPLGRSSLSGLGFVDVVRLGLLGQRTTVPPLEGRESSSRADHVWYRVGIAPLADVFVAFWHCRLLVEATVDRVGTNECEQLRRMFDGLAEHFKKLIEAHGASLLHEVTFLQLGHFLDLLIGESAKVADFLKVCSHYLSFVSVLMGKASTKNAHFARQNRQRTC